MSDDPLRLAGHLGGIGAVLGQPEDTDPAGLAAALGRAGIAAPVLGAAGRTALRRELASRFIDPAAENAIAAARAAVAATPGAAALIAATPSRAAILAASRHGAEDTRERLFRGLAERSHAISGTLFSNAGYNIAGSLTARALVLRGAALTIAAGSDADRDLLRLAALFLKAGRADLLVIGVAERGAALAFTLTRDGDRPLAVPATGDGLDGLCRLAAGEFR